MLLGGRTGGQFTKKSQQGGGRFLIGKIFEDDSCCEVRGFRVEANADKILVAPRGQRVDYGAEFDGPVFLRSQNDGPRAADGPCPIALGDLRPSPRPFSSLARPAMPYNIQVEAWRKSHIGFEGEGLLLLPPAT